jgi:hypothetical protein
MTEPRVLAKFDGYPGMLFAFRARASERQFSISSDDNNDKAGLSERRLTQMLSLQTLKNLKNVRRVGMNSLGPLLGFLGAELWLVESKWAMDKFDGKLKKRNEAFVRNDVVHVVRNRRHFRKMGLKGGANSRKSMSKRKARELGKNAAAARWSKARETPKPIRGSGPISAGRASRTSRAKERLLAESELRRSSAGNAGRSSPKALRSAATQA